MDKNRLIIVGGAGRMGGTLARMAKSAGFDLVGMVERKECLGSLEGWDCLLSDNPDKLFASQSGAVVIDFTTPDTSLRTAHAAVNHGCPLVIGTTGFTVTQKEELQELAQVGPIFWSPSMSVGINVLLNVLPDLVRKLGPDYDLELVEIHHGRKKDAPSGTALRLAESLADGRTWDLDEVAQYSRVGLIGERPKEEIGIQSIRGGDVAGVHTVYFLGQGERIEITHHAHSRDNFARGALRAARWMIGRRPGKLYSMQDILASE